jgi:CBS domain-containing protein
MTPANTAAPSASDSPNTPNTLILATVEHLARFAPFDGMAREHLIWLAERLQLGYFAKGEALLEPEHGEVVRLFIIKQGIVQGEREDSVAWLELHEGESFPLGALLSNRPAISTFRAKNDVFTYELTAEDFHTLLKLSPEYHDFCTRRIAALLAKSQQSLQAEYATAASGQQSLEKPLSSIIQRKPVTCTPDTPLESALETIQANAISAIVVAENDKPVGIFTVRDLIGRVVLPGTPLDTPIRQLMTSAPKFLAPSDHAFEAALLMAQGGFRHILVVDKGHLVGVVSEKDLFSLQRVGVTRISAHIRAAEELKTLQDAAADIRLLAHNMLAQGVTSEQLTQLISTLNDLLTSRIIELQLARDPAAAKIEFCWLALGSEGRLEQTLNTDQDNGIIFVIPPGQDAASVRTTLLPFAKRVNDDLDACGFPLCNGMVMASNPKWCLSLDEWKTTFDNWIYHGDPRALLYSTIFFDFRPLFGAEHLGVALREWLTAEARKNSRFLHQMTVNALRNRPPLGLVRDFVTGDGNTLDLKLNGITPFIDAARIYSLAKGVAETNTLLRLRGIAPLLNIKPQDAEAYGDAFLFIQLLRLRLHHEQSEQGEALSNKIDPDQLNDLDRRILKEAFRQARKLQTKLGVDYQV